MTLTFNLQIVLIDCYCSKCMEDFRKLSVAPISGFNPRECSSKVFIVEKSKASSFVFICFKTNKRGNFLVFFCSVKWNNQTNKKFNKILRVANKWKNTISSSYRNLKESMMMKKQWLWLENQVTCPVPVSLCVILCSMIWTEGGRGTRNRCEDLKKKIPPKN